MAIFLVDVSGSLLQDQIAAMRAKLVTSSAAGDRVIPFDHETYRPMSVQSFLSAPTTRGGGTCIRLALQAAQDYRKGNEDIHLLTDGVFEQADLTGINVHIF